MTGDKEEEVGMRNALQVSGLSNQVDWIHLLMEWKQVLRGMELGGAGSPLRKRTHIDKGKIRFEHGYLLRMRKISKYKTLKADISRKK